MYARSDKRPIVIQDFLNSEDVRRRYWARNYIGWPRFSSVVPNATHYILKELEEVFLSGNNPCMKSLYLL